jgi:predicted acyltransferase
MLSNVNSALFLVGVAIQFPAPPYAPKSKKIIKFFDKGAENFKLCYLPEHQNKR